MMTFRINRSLLVSLFVGTLVASLNATAQEIDPESGLLTYTGVVEVPNTPKDDLYLRAKTWVVKTLQFSPSILQMDEKEAGKLIGKGGLAVLITHPFGGYIDAGRVNVTITMICKDNKYKYVVDHFYHEAPVWAIKDDHWLDGGPLEQDRIRGGIATGPTRKQWNDIKAVTSKEWKSLIAELRKAMATSDTDF